MQSTQEFNRTKEVGLELLDLQFLIIEAGLAGVAGDGFLISRLEIREQDVADAQAGAADFILVGGADAFEGAADFSVAAGFLVDAVEGAVAGQDELGFLGDIEVSRPVHSPIGQLLQLLTEHDGVEDDAVADYINNVGVKDAAWHLVQHVLEAVEGEGVAGVGAALEAGYYVVGGGEDIDDFAFAFVAPLEAD